MQFKIFPALFEKPEKISFEMQEVDETLELFLRAHWITNVPWVLITIFSFFLPLILIQLEPFLGLPFLESAPIQIILGGLIIYYLLLTAYVIESFLFWYYNIGIVTNKHIIDINFNSLLSKQRIELGLEDVELVTQSTGGVLDSLLNFGDIIVRSAAEHESIMFDNTPRPDFVVDRIKQLVEARKLFFESGDD